FRSCAPFRKPLGRHRRRLRQITAPLIPAFQSLTFAAARENPWNRGSVAKVGLASCLISLRASSSRASGGKFCQFLASMKFPVNGSRLSKYFSPLGVKVVSTRYSIPQGSPVAFI